MSHNTCLNKGVPMQDIKREIEFVAMQLRDDLITRDMAVRKLRRMGLTTKQILNIMGKFD